ncbi:hypothetical protein [Mycobacterium sp. IDR2000157661]|uniref:hypothetical protein n=1 Tax=Mycobacterium sp. IDR2000157661 TaxID=2867005 RepID=UPI001EEA6F16|nr:hypothetical protein [Mycobacterium sp. IDR2000157661]ULE32419.1 hypothetical protein K3G64_20215 [Mycobacterium sp. IDR2000157661]
MGFWRRAFRPGCLGLFVEKGVLYAERDIAEPPFRSLGTAEQRRSFLAPAAVPLKNARVFLDIELGSRRPLEIPVGATVHRPAAPPPSRGDKLYTVSVHTESNDVFIGYPADGGQARNVLRAIERLVRAAG